MLRCTFTARGTVVHVYTQQPLPSLRVQAWDGDLDIQEALAEVESDEQGQFSFSLDRDPLRRQFREREPALFFRVYNQGQLVADTADTHRWEPGQRELLVIEVELPEMVEELPDEPDITPDRLRALNRQRALTPRQLREEDPEQFANLVRVAADDLRETIACHLEQGSEEAEVAFAEVDFDLLVRQPLAVKPYVESALRQQQAPEEAREEVAQTLAKVDLPETVFDHVQMDTPVGHNALYIPLLRRGATYAIGDLASVDEDVLDELAAREQSLLALSNTDLKALVEEGLLEEENAQELGLTANLYQWTGGEPGLMQTVREGMQTPDGQPVRTLRDVAVAAPTRAEMADLLRQAPLADEQEPEALAEQLIRPLERLFPHAMFKAQQAPLPPRRNFSESWQKKQVKHQDPCGDQFLSHLQPRGLSMPLPEVEDPTNSSHRVIIASSSRFTG